MRRLKSELVYSFTEQEKKKDRNQQVVKKIFCLFLNWLCLRHCSLQPADPAPPGVRERSQRRHRGAGQT